MKTSLFAKIIAVVCALLMIVSLAACGSSKTNGTDDKNSTTISSSASSTADSKTDSAVSNAEKTGNSDILGSWEYESGGYTYTFNEDGTGVYDLGTSTMEFTYEVTDTQLSILYTGNTSPMVLEYEIDGNKLNVKDSFGKDTIYIKK